jgi:hypothetical protein
MVTQLMDKVEQFKLLAAQLDQIKEEIITLQRNLAEVGVVITLPVMGPPVGDSVTHQIGKPLSEAVTTRTPAKEYLIAHPVIPDMEEHAGEEVADQEDLSRPLPHADRRTAEQISKELRVPPSAADSSQFIQNIQADFDRAVNGGMADGDRKKGRR